MPPDEVQSVTHDVEAVNLDADPSMDIKISSLGSLERQLKPEQNFISSAFLSQKSSGTQASPSQLLPENGPLSIDTPSNSEMLARLNWRFNGPSVVTPNSDCGDSTSYLVRLSVIKPHDLTPPRSPAVSPVHSHQDEAIESPGMVDTQADSAFSSQNPSPDVMPSQHQRFLNDVLSNMDSESYNPPLDTDSPGSSETAPGAIIGQVSSDQPDQSSHSESNDAAPVKQESSDTNPTDSCKAAQHGRKRKCNSKNLAERERRKREQNKRAAKRYRDKVAAKTHELFEEQKNLEEEVAKLKRRLERTYNERNINLSLLHGSAARNNTLHRYTFPSWFEPPA